MKVRLPRLYRWPLRPEEREVCDTVMDAFGPGLDAAAGILLDHVGSAGALRDALNDHLDALERDYCTKENPR